MAYFRYTARRFWSQKWDFAKIVKTSTKQLYNKPTNQKWQNLDEKRALHCPKTEMSTDGGTDGGTEGQTDMLIAIPFGFLPRGKKLRAVSLLYGYAGPLLLHPKS